MPVTRIAEEGLAAIVLAAGAGKRFGGVKQLALLDGIPLVVRAVRLAHACCPAGVIVVTGSHAAEIEAVLAGEPVCIVRNTDWQSGLAASIRCGVDASTGSAVTAWLMLLADQAQIEGEDLRRLVDAWARRPDEAAASSYEDALGVPAIFPTRFREQLRSLAGDAGARNLLAALPDATAVPMPSAAYDIDRLSDLQPKRPVG